MRKTMPAITTLANQLATRNSVARTMPQKPNSGKAYCGCEVEHVPSDPEEQGAEQERCDECQERNGEPAGDERAEPEDSQHDAEDGTHVPSL